MANGDRPTPEFRREPARLALTSGRTRREIAEDLGIGLSTPRWPQTGDRDTSPDDAAADAEPELVTGLRIRPTDR